MPFTTYSELQTAIATRIDRSDVSTVVVDWIANAEKEINRWLHVSWTEKRAYAVPTSAFVALPTDFNGLRNVQWNYSNYRLNLEQVSPDMLDKVCPSSLVGVPEFYAIHDSQIELRPAPASDNATQIEISYYFKPTALSDSNTSNEILSKIPDVLFYRALVEASDYFNDDMRAAKYMQMYEKAKADVFAEERRLSWGKAPMRTVADSMRGL